MPKKLDYIPQRVELSIKERLKKEKEIVKLFGKAGLKLFKSIDGRKNVEQLANLVGIDRKKIVEIIDWLEEQGLITLSTMQKEEGEIEFEKKIKEKELEIESNEKTEENEQKEMEVTETEIYSALEKIKGKLKDIISEEEGGEKEVEKNISEKNEIIEPIDDEKIEEEEEKISSIEKEIEDENEKRNRKEKEEKIFEPEEKEKIKEEGEKISSIKEEIEDEYEKEYKDEEEKIEPLSESEESGEIKPEFEDEILDPIKKTIKEKYGDVGLRVYELIDGQRSAEEIMKETGISEGLLIEILEFMEKEGIIKLESESKSKEKINEFTPLTEEKIEENIGDKESIEVPIKVSGGVIENIKAITEIIVKSGEKGKKIFESIDGEKTEIDLSIKLKIPLYEVREIINNLLKLKVVKIKKLSREEIAHKYGEEALNLFKKFGREGVLLYEMIGKDLSIKEMAKMVTTDINKFADMFIFAHKVLGVEIPVDKEVILMQLKDNKK